MTLDSQRKADFVEGFCIGYRAAELRSSVSAAVLEETAAAVFADPERTLGSGMLVAARCLARKPHLGVRNSCGCETKKRAAAGELSANSLPSGGGGEQSGLSDGGTNLWSTFVGQLRKRIRCLPQGRG